MNQKTKIATNLLDSGSLNDDDSPLHVQAKLGQGAPTIKYASKTKKIIQNEQILHFRGSKLFCCKRDVTNLYSNYFFPQLKANVEHNTEYYF